MFFKKLSILSLAVTLILSIFATSSFAKTEEEQILFEKIEITDIEQLWNRAQEGINDPGVTQENASLAKGQVVLSGNDTTITTETFSTTQLLKTKKNKSGEIIESFATTTFAVVKENKKEKENDSGELTILASYYDEKWDSTYAVKAYATLYWDWKYDSSGVKHADMTSVSGGWSYDGTGNYILSGRKVKVGQVGTSSWGSTSSQIVNYTPSSNSWSYTVDSAWKPVNINKYSSVGITSDITITRGTSSWGLNFIHQIN